MYNTLIRVGRLSLNEVKRRRLFMSFVVCRDERNHTVIVGCRSPYLLTYNQPYIQAYRKQKVHFSKVIKNAYLRGSFLPRHSDLETTEPVVLKIVDSFDVNKNVPMEVYEWYI